MSLQAAACAPRKGGCAGSQQPPIPRHVARLDCCTCVWGCPCLHAPATHWPACWHWQGLVAIVTNLWLMALVQCCPAMGGWPKSDRLRLDSDTMHALNSVDSVCVGAASCRYGYGMSLGNKLAHDPLACCSFLSSAGYDGPSNCSATASKKEAIHLSLAARSNGHSGNAMAHVCHHFHGLWRRAVEYIAYSRYSSGLSTAFFHINPQCSNTCQLFTGSCCCSLF